MEECSLMISIHHWLVHVIALAWQAEGKFIKYPAVGRGDKRWRWLSLAVMEWTNYPARPHQIDMNFLQASLFVDALPRPFRPLTAKDAIMALYISFKRCWEDLKCINFSRSLTTLVKGIFFWEWLKNVFWNVTPRMIIIARSPLDSGEFILRPPVSR